MRADSEGRLGPLLVNVKREGPSLKCSEAGLPDLGCITEALCWVRDRKMVEWQTVFSSPVSSPVSSEDQINNQPNPCGVPAFPPPSGGPILELLICFHRGLNKLNLLIKVVKWNAEHYWLDANAINGTKGEGPRLPIAAQIRSAEAIVQAAPEGRRDRPICVMWWSVIERHSFSK